jgi:hypothetical protein
MILGTKVAAFLALAATTVLAQAVPPATTPVTNPQIPQVGSTPFRPGANYVTRNATNSAQPAAPSKAVTELHQQVQDMEDTLAKMGKLLKQMRAKAAANPKDQVAKANLQMWDLMVGHLNKQLAELRVAVQAREDMEARRAAMYKQAYTSSGAAAPGQNPSQAPVPGPVAPVQAQRPTAPPNAGQTMTTPATPSTPQN